MCQEPRLTIYHDLVTAAEIRYMKAAVLRDLMVATIVDTEDSSGDGKKVSNERTQSSGWLWEQASSRGVNEISQVLVFSMKDSLYNLCFCNYEITFTTPPPQDHALLARLTRRTELVTGLEISAHLAHDPYRTFAAEAWQMGLYGSGGHYLPHYDAFDTVSSCKQSNDVIFVFKTRM